MALEYTGTLKPKGTAPRASFYIFHAAYEVTMLYLVYTMNLHTLVITKPMSL